MSPLRARIGDQQLPDLDPGRPLLVVDADEVLVHFAAPFERYLNARGIAVEWKSYALVGNIREVATGRALDHQELFGHADAYFETEIHEQPAVAHAAETLRVLSDDWQIMVLTNLPATCRDMRVARLAELGMAYPLLCNQGGKGTVMRALTSHFTAPTAFVDDAAPNHVSVKKHAPHVHRVHFIADPRLAAIAETPPEVDHRVDDWPGLRLHLKTVLERR